MDELAPFDYELPESAIAQTPLMDRSASKLLHLHRESGQIEHLSFKQVPEILREGDLLVVNDTKVAARRMFGEKESGGKVELLLLKSLGAGRYEALAKPAKRLRPGARLILGQDLLAKVENDLGEGLKIVVFQPRPDLEEAIARGGYAPLPPYVRTELKDADRYQTVYASKGESAAAPSAGLHFTPEILSQLAEKGVEIARVNLDIGLDTFRPISTEKMDEHRMRGERCWAPPETAEKVASCKGRIVAVGTTAVRVLETFAAGPRRIESGERVSTLFIRPGYEFQVVDGMFTNFHMPRTSMLVMISALARVGPISKAYEAALRNRYRFLSFGDSMLIL